MYTTPLDIAIHCNTSTTFIKNLDVVIPVSRTSDCYVLNINSYGSVVANEVEAWNSLNNSVVRGDLAAERNHSRCRSINKDALTRRKCHIGETCAIFRKPTVGSITRLCSGCIDIHCNTSTTFIKNLDVVIPVGRIGNLDVLNVDATITDSSKGRNHKVESSNRILRLIADNKWKGGVS